MSSEVREPLVEGIFYPSSKKECAELFPDSPTRGVEAGEDAAADTEPARMSPEEVQALLLPHAAYEFILPYLVDGFGLVAHRSPAPRRVIAVGALHRERRSGIFLPPHAAFRSPAGEISLDGETRERILSGVEGAVVDEMAYEEEHVLDTLLPPLSLYLPGARLLPVLTGDESRVTVRALAQLLELAEDEDSLVLISANLSAETDAANLEARSGALLSTLSAYEKHEHEASETGTGRSGEASLLRLHSEGRIDSCGTAALAALLSQHPDCRMSLLRRGSSLSGEETTGVGYGAAAFSYENAVKEAQHGTRAHG